MEGGVQDLSAGTALKERRTPKAAVHCFSVSVSESGKQEAGMEGTWELKSNVLRLSPSSTHPLVAWAQASCLNSFGHSFIILKLGIDNVRA